MHITILLWEFKKYKLILDIYIYPKIESDMYIGFEYEVTVNLVNMNENNINLDIVEFEAKGISDLIKLMNIFLPYISLNLNKYIENKSLKISCDLEVMVNEFNLGNKVLRT
ncbi:MULTISPECIES: hypothetical protein [unclassified Acinetobacter]